MKKIALTPNTETLLKGIGNWAGMGAGVGALGMGAANMLQPEDEQHKKRSLLKSMLLGGALGGVVGGGGRAIADSFSPELAQDPGNGMAVLNPSKPLPQPTHSQAGLFDRTAGGYPVSTGLSVGAATTGASKMMQKAMKGTELRRIYGPHFDADKAKLGTEPLKDVAGKLAPLSKFKAWSLNPAIHGLGAAALTTAYGEAIRPRLIDEQKLNMEANPFSGYPSQ